MRLHGYCAPRLEKGKKGWREVREEEPSRVASGAQREKKLVQAENKLFATRMSLGACYAHHGIIRVSHFYQDLLPIL